MSESYFTLTLEKKAPDDKIPVERAEDVLRVEGEYFLMTHEMSEEVSRGPTINRDDLTKAISVIETEWGLPERLAIVYKIK